MPLLTISLLGHQSTTIASAPWLSALRWASIWPDTSFKVSGIHVTPHGSFGICLGQGQCISEELYQWWPNFASRRSHVRKKRWKGLECGGRASIHGPWGNFGSPEREPGDAASAAGGPKWLGYQAAVPEAVYLVEKPCFWAEFSQGIEKIFCFFHIFDFYTAIASKQKDAFCVFVSTFSKDVGNVPTCKEHGVLRPMATGLTTGQKISSGIGRIWSCGSDSISKHRLATLSYLFLFFFMGSSVMSLLSKVRSFGWPCRFVLCLVMLCEHFKSRSTVSRNRESTTSV